MQKKFIVKEANDKVLSRTFDSYEQALKFITDVFERDNEKAYSFSISSNEN